jgi:hypothetical protein
MLDRTRGDRTALPLARGILEPPADRDNVDFEELAVVVVVLRVVVLVVLAVAARCAPSLAMMREREMRGFREDVCVVIFVVVVNGDAAGTLSGLWVPLRAGVLAAVVAREVAAAAREVGLTGDSINNGVVNIFPGDEGAPPGPPWGLFVIASRTTVLRGGVLARCAIMLFVLDFLKAAVAGAVDPSTAVGPRVLARELAVGANSLDVVLLWPKMEALSLLPLLVELARTL